MKKLLSVCLSTLMLVGGFAMAEDAVIEPVIGQIVEVREDGSFIVDKFDGSQVHVQTDEDTVYSADWSVGQSDVVLVTYNGQMTRSLPPQIHALTISSYTLEGDVEEIDTENHRILVDSPEVGEVWVTLPENADIAAYEDKDVRIYFNGIMAMSLPGQIHALTIEFVEDEDGRVIEKGDDYFIIEDDGSQIRVVFDEKTKITKSFDVGDEVKVYYSGIMTRSMPPQIYAAVVVVEND